MRLLRLLGFAVAVIATLSVVGVAWASPQQVIRDYNHDGLIDGTYSPTDLRLAEGMMVHAAQYGDFSSQVGDKLDEALLGVRSGTRPPGNVQVSDELIPRPAATTGGNDSLPWGFLALFALAGLLLASGIASAAYRRLRR